MIVNIEVDLEICEGSGVNRKPASVQGMQRNIDVLRAAEARCGVSRICRDGNAWNFPALEETTA